MIAVEDDIYKWFPLSKRAWFYMILRLFCSWFSLWKSHFKVEHRADTATIRKAYLQKQPLWLGENSRRKDDDSKEFWWKPQGNSGIIWNYLIWFDLRLSDSWMNYLEEGEPARACSVFFVLALPATLRSLSLSSHVHLSLLNAIEAYVCSRPLKFSWFQDVSRLNKPNFMGPLIPNFSAHVCCLHRQWIFKVLDLRKMVHPDVAGDEAQEMGFSVRIQSLHQLSNHRTANDRRFSSGHQTRRTKLENTSFE